MLRAARALAAWEQAQAVTAMHVERVAEAVLRHRRHDRHGDDPRSDEANDAAGEADRSQSPDHGDGHGGKSASPSANGDSDGDWGYMPPEPTTTTQVKRVVPLNAKKR
jgi:magnesium chelatase subunit I